MKQIETSNVETKSESGIGTSTPSDSCSTGTKMTHSATNVARDIPISKFRSLKKDSDLIAFDFLPGTVCDCKTTDLFCDISLDLLDCKMDTIFRKINVHDLEEFVDFLVEKVKVRILLKDILSASLLNLWIKKLRHFLRNGHHLAPRPMILL